MSETHTRKLLNSVATITNIESIIFSAMRKTLHASSCMCDKELRLLNVRNVIADSQSNIFFVPIAQRIMAMTSLNFFCIAAGVTAVLVIRNISPLQPRMRKRLPAVNIEFVKYWGDTIYLSHLKL